MPVRFAFAPQFSASAVGASSALRQAGIEVASVRVVIRRTFNGDELFNRLITVAPGASSVTLEADVLLRSAEEELTAFLEFLDSAGTVLYRGEQRVIARAGNDNAVTIDTQIEFVGPGANAATVRVTPADTTIPTKTPLALQAVALDASGAPITAAILLWSSSDAALAAVSPSGVVTPVGARGSVLVTARTPLGIAGAATIRLMPPAARIVVIGGAQQAGTAGSTLAQPFTVEVQAADGLPVPGEPVTFSAVTPGGVVTTTTTTSDAQGRATTSIKLGTATGVYEFRAVSGSLGAVTIAASASAAAASTLAILSGNSQTATVGTALTAPLVVKVRDAFGNLVPGAAVKWQVVAGTGTISTTASTSDASGHASVSYTAGNVPTTESVKAILDGTSAAATFSVTVKVGPAAQIAVVSGDAQVAVAGSVLPAPLVVQVKDALGNLVPGATVKWTVTTGNATLAQATSVTGENGKAVATVTLGSPAATPTTASITATLASGAGAAFTATITPAPLVPAKLVITHQPPSTIRSGSGIGAPVRVQIADSAGRAIAVAGRVVSAAVYSASVNRMPADGASALLVQTLSLTGTTSVASDSSGAANFPDLVVTGLEGPVTLSFTSGTLPVVSSSTTTLTAGDLAKLTILPSAPATPFVVAAGQPIAENVWLETTDASGNRVAEAPVRFVTRIGGSTGPVTHDTTLLSNAIGEIGASRFPVLSAGGTYHVTASIMTDGAAPAIFTVQVNALAASAIVYGALDAVASGDRQVAMIGSMLAQPLLVKVLDANGVPLANTDVEWRRRSNLTATVLVDTTTTDAAGVASLQPTLPASDTYFGHIFEASPVAAPSLVLRFRTAGRAGDQDAVWFGPLASDGSSLLGYADWAVPDNWSGGIVPGISSNVLIPAWDNAWVASPQLSGSAAVRSIVTGSGFAFPYLSIGAQALSVGDTLRGTLVEGTGTIRMNGTSSSIGVHAPAATLVVPPGATASLGTFTRVKHATIGGTLRTGEESLQLEGGELLVTGQLLMTGGAVYGGTNVVFENTTFDSTNTGSITFAQLFEQRGTMELELPEDFTVYADVGAGGKTATVRFADSSSSLGTLVVKGPAVGVPSTLTIDGAAEVSGELAVDGLVNVTGTVLRLESDSVVLPATVSLAGLATLESRGYYAPIFGGTPPQMTESWAAELNGPSQFNHLRVRETMQVYSHPFRVAGNLEVLGANGALRMMGQGDTVAVGGSVTFASDVSGNLRYGVIRIGGDLSYIGTADFRPDTLATGTKFVFEGKAEQKVTFAPRLRGAVAYLGNLVVAPGSAVRQATTLRITGLASIGGTWIADSGLVVDGRLDVLGGEKPGRLETYAGTSIRRLDMQSGSQWRNGSESAMRLTAANFFAGSQIWNGAGLAVQVDACYDGGYTLTDITQLRFICILQIPFGSVANLAPMPNAGSLVAASRP